MKNTRRSSRLIVAGLVGLVMAFIVLTGCPTTNGDQSSGNQSGGGGRYSHMAY